ncbi:DUF4355 domain-containing protein [Christensenellaceae bacterium OttesenSCG-928-M15]|nr:DUF4355 domain-containing protein [Christensenellaceae bacterium OttesenSCG-928-M15]
MANELQNGASSDVPATAASAAENKAAPASVAEKPAAAAAPEAFTAEQVAELKKQWAEETKAATEKAAQEAAELAKLSEAEQQKKLLEKSQDELKTLQAKVADAELTTFASKQLEESKLPQAALLFVKGTDEATTKERIKAFGEMYAAAVQQGVEDRFKAAGQKYRAPSTQAPAAQDKPERKRGIQFLSRGRK